MKTIHSTPGQTAEIRGLSDDHGLHLNGFEGVVERPPIVAHAVMPFEMLIQDAFDGSGSVIVCVGGRPLHWVIEH
jgi:hypothetical protein